MKTHHNIDPVCGMDVTEPDHLQFKYKGKDYHFCSKLCHDRFAVHPDKYVHSPESIQKVDNSPFKTYFPLILIFFYLISGVVLFEWKSFSFDMRRFMIHFMGWFFVVFSFFKFLDLKGFANGYRAYDLIAKRFPFYGYLFPFVELVLGLCYLLSDNMRVVNILTAIVMFVSTLGVAQSLRKKRHISCACLGTVFKLPMSTVTLFEDLLMFVMAFWGAVFW